MHHDEMQLSRADRGERRAGVFRAVMRWVGRSIVAHVVATTIAVVGATGCAAQGDGDPVASRGRKIVGLVFDDSGSMKNRIQLPAFAAQLLVASLDPKRDRLFTARLSTWEAAVRDPAVAHLLAQDGGVNPQSMARLRARQTTDLPRDEFAQGTPESVVDTIRTQWPVARSDTPYGPVELMLETLVAEARPGDEAHLVILTDGKFEPDPPDGARVQRDFELYRGRLKAPLFVDYVLIAPADAEGAQVRVEVRRQGVRHALTSVFNGTPDDPLFEVSSSGELLAAMFDVIARINATDRSARLAGGIVRVADRRLSIDSPLSVSRIVGVTFAPTGEEPPRITATSFTAAPSLTIQSRMDKADSAAGWRDERNQARSVQFNLPTALAAGAHSIDFDRAVGDRYLFLFDTLARFEVEIRDGSGQPLPVGRDGVPEAVAGQPLQVVTAIKDRVDGKDKDVDIASLAGATVSAWVEGAAGRVAVALSADPAGKRQVGAMTAGGVGSYEAGGSFVLDGFVRKEARRPQFRVIDGTVAPKMTMRAVDCTGCGPGEMRTRLRPDAPRATLGEIDIRMPSDRPVPFSLSLEGSPAWVGLETTDGKAVARGQPMVAGPDGHMVLRLVRDLAHPDEPHDHDRPIAVRLAASAPFTGQATAEAVLHVEVPEAKLVYTGHSRGGDPAAALTLSPDDLAGGRETLNFELQGLSGFAIDPADLVVTTRSALVRYTLARDGEHITVRPEVSMWMRCAACLLWSPSEVEVRYRGLGEAKAVAPLHFRATAWEILETCAWWLFGLFLLILLSGAAVVWVRTPRFPGSSFAMIKRPNQPVVAQELLRRWDFEGNWRTVRWALVWQSRPARTHVEGLHLEAANGGVRLLLRGTNENVKVNADGRTVKKIKEELRNRDFVSLPWNSTFTERRSFELLTVRRG